MFLAEALRVGDELHGTGCDYVNINDFPLGDVDVYGRVYVDEVVTGQHSGLERLLDTVHGILHAPLLRALTVLEPGAAMVDGNNDRAREVHPFCLETHGAHEIFLRHAGIAAVTVYLVEGGGKVDGRVVPLGGAQGGPDDGGRIGTGRENGTRDTRLFPQAVQFVEKILCLRHNAFKYIRLHPPPRGRCSRRRKDCPGRARSQST